MRKNSLKLPDTYKAPIAVSHKSIGLRTYPDKWAMSGERQRYECNGSKGNRVGDIIKVWRREGRWQKVLWGDKIYKRRGVKAVITQRYFTINKCFRNYHARVQITEGELAGKNVSIRY